jgi:hypothetical protein
VVVTIISVLWFVGVAIGILLYLRLPGRVLVPLEAGVALFAVLLPTYLTPPKKRPSPSPTNARPRWTAVAVIALVAIFAAGPAWNGVRSASRISNNNRLGVNTTEETLNKLRELDPQGIFMGRGDLIGRWAEPLSTSSAFGNPRLVPLGWTTNSPLFTARIGRLGIDDLYTALRTNSHVYLLGFPQDGRRIQTYYFQHQQVRTKFTVRLGGLHVLYGPLVGSIGVWSVSTVTAR